MANQTVSTSQSLESAITGLNAGQNLTINGGAVITMTETNTILIGRITINEGELFIDGENISAGNSISLICEGGDASVNETMTIRGQGLFKTRGAWFDIGTTNGTDSQVINVGSSGNDLWNGDKFISWLPMIQVETGRRVNFDNDVGVTPKVGDWLRLTSDRKSSMGKIKEVGVGYVILWYFTGSISDNDEIQIRSVVDNFGPDLQVSWTANAVGSDVLETGVYHEFGNSVSGGVDSIGAFHHGLGGFVFSHVAEATTITLGSSAGTTGGFRPPNGCNIRVPNIMLGSAISADFSANNATMLATDVELDYSRLEFTGGGSVDMSITNVGNYNANDAGAFNFDASFVGASVALGSFASANKTTYDHCMICQDPVNLSLGTIRYAYFSQDNVSGTKITFCQSVAPRTARNAIGAETSIGVEVSDCIISNAGQNNLDSSNTDLYRFSKCADVSFTNNVAIGNNHIEQDRILYINATPNFHATDFMFSATQSEIEQTIESSAVLFTSNSNNGSAIGIEVIGNGTMGNHLTSITDCVNVKIRCFGMIDDKVDFGVDGEYCMAITGLCDNVSAARVWKNTGSTISEEFTSIPSTARNISVINCSGKYLSEIQPSGNNTRFRGIHGGAGTPGSVTGWEDGYSGAYGYNFYDAFRSDTAGIIGCLMITPSATVDETTVIAGNPLFFKDGDLDMKNGDIIEIKQSYFSLGHIRFSGGYTATTQTSSWNANEWSNVTLLFKWKSKSGAVWSSSWLDLRNPANLTSIPDFDDGIMLWHRLEATGTQNDMSMLLIDTVTTIQAQKDNFYPIDQVENTLTLTGLEIGSDVVILGAGTNTVLASVDQTAGTTFSYTYQTLDAFDIGIIKAGFVTQYIYGFGPSAVDSNLPIIQRIDRNYK